MSRVHEALRRAEQLTPRPATPGVLPDQSAAREPLETPPNHLQTQAALAPFPLEGLLGRVQEIPFTPSQEALLIDPRHPHEAPTEEFRTLRTRLNHMQTLTPIHTA